jgi:hypothetical protein
MIAISNVVRFDTNIAGYNDIEYFSYDKLLKMYPEEAKKMKLKRSCSVVHLKVKLPFPLNTPRFFLMISTVDYDPKNQVLSLRAQRYSLTVEYI